MSDTLIHTKNHDTLYAGHNLKSHTNTGSENQLSSKLLNDNNPLGAPDWMGAIMQEDGNFVVYFAEGHFRSATEGHAKWATSTQGHGIAPYSIGIASNGNLVLTDSRGEELWHTPLWEGPTKEPCRLVMQDDGNLVIYDANNHALWATGTNGQNHA